MLLSGLVLLLLVFRKEKMRTFAIWKNRKDVGQLLAFALLFGLTEMSCQYTFLGAIKYSNSATATVLQSLNVIFMAVIVAIQSRTRIGILADAGPSFSRLWAPSSLRQKAMPHPDAAFSSRSSAWPFSLPQAWSSIHFCQGPSFLTGETYPSPDGACSSVASSCFWAHRAWTLPPMLQLYAQHGLMIAVIVLIGTAVGFSAFLEGVRYIDGEGNADRLPGTSIRHCPLGIVPGDEIFHGRTAGIRPDSSDRVSLGSGKKRLIAALWQIG